MSDFHDDKNTVEQGHSEQEFDEMNPMQMADISKHPLFEKAYELAVKDKRTMHPHEIAKQIRLIIASLTGVGYSVPGARTIQSWPLPTSQDGWKESIQEDYIQCLICGERKKLLTEPHIKKHGGTKNEYREHFFIPPGTALASKKLIERRRDDIKTSEIWKARKRKGSRKGSDDIFSMLVEGNPKAMEFFGENQEISLEGAIQKIDEQRIDTMDFKGSAEITLDGIIQKPNDQED